MHPLDQTPIGRAEIKLLISESFWNGIDRAAENAEAIAAQGLGSLPEVRQTVRGAIQRSVLEIFLRSGDRQAVPPERQRT